MTFFIISEAYVIVFLTTCSSITQNNLQRTLTLTLHLQSTFFYPSELFKFIETTSAPA